MGSTTEVNAPSSPEEMLAIQQQIDRINKAEGRTPVIPAAPTAFVPQRLQFDAASNRVTDIGPVEIQMSIPLEPGFVNIPGIGKTTIEAAKIAGLIPSDFREGREGPAPSTAIGKNSAGNDSDTTQGSKGDPADLDAGLPAEAKEAKGLLRSAVAVAGIDAVQDHLWFAAEEGEIPETLPPGMTTEKAEKVLAGYEAYANAELAATGANVSTLREMLDSTELRKARHAAVGSDKTALAHLGRVAMERLAVMPDRDPQGFQEALETMPANERRLLYKDEHTGTWMLKGSPQSVPFGEAVRRGWIKFKPDSAA